MGSPIFPMNDFIVQTKIPVLKPHRGTGRYLEWQAKIGALGSGMARVTGIMDIDNMFCHQAEAKGLRMPVEKADVYGLIVEPQLMKRVFRATGLAEVGISFDKHIIDPDGDPLHLLRCQSQ